MDRLRSRKLWMAVATALLVVANEGFDLRLPEEAMLTVAAIVITYILGQSYVDRSA